VEKCQKAPAHSHTNTLSAGKTMPYKYAKRTARTNAKQRKSGEKKQKESAQKSEEKRGVDTKTTFNAIQQSCDSFCTLENIKFMEGGLIKHKKV